MKKLLERYDYFLIDLWGVLWDGREVFPDGVAFVHRLIDAGKSFRFLSNCAEYTDEELVDRLRIAGLTDARTEWLATSGQSMVLWFEQNGLKGRKVYVFGGEGLWENVRRAGAEPIAMPEKGELLKTGAESDTLIVGGLLNFDWLRLTEIVTGVRMGHLRVVLPNPDKVVMQQSGRVRLPPGMIVEVIAIALPETPIERVGKPFRFVYDYAFSLFGDAFDPRRALMVGDSLETDARGAAGAGIDMLLLGQGVLMGKQRDEIIAASRALHIYPQWFAERLTPEDGLFESVDWRPQP